MSFKLAKPWFKDKRVCVVGLGKSGAAAANLLSRLGARVRVTEKRPASKVREWVERLAKGIPAETGGHSFLRHPMDLLVASPGVKSDLWQPLADAGLPVWGEMELGYRVLSLEGRWPARVASVTGTNGKTTTTALLGDMFRREGWQTVVGGNMGTPLCSVLDHVSSHTGLVLEVSSYMLETAQAFQPSVGALLNVTPDHLGRHKTMARYAAAKFKLFANQRANDAAVLNLRDPWCRRLSSRAPAHRFWFGFGRSRAPGVTFTGGCLVSTLPGAGGRWQPPAHLPGLHNIENALAAVACARALGVSSGAIAETLGLFRGVEHRIETVRVCRGVRYVNDSKATNVDSTLVALKSFSGGLRVILGGEHKGSPYRPLAPLLKKVAREVLTIGDAAPLIEKDLKGILPVTPCGTLERAVKRAYRNAVPGDVVLLSPACASFDQFQNFEHRGQCFKDLVRALPG